MVRDRGPFIPFGVVFRLSELTRGFRIIFRTFNLTQITFNLPANVLAIQQLVVHGNELKEMCTFELV